MRAFCKILLALTALLIMGGRAAQAEAFKSAKECVQGKRVIDLRGRAGKIVKVADSVSCTVQFDKEARSETLLFWMLHAEGGSAETNDKLVPGTYECFAGGRYTFMDMKILSANTYESAGTKGTFRVEPSRKIVFQSGSLSKYHAKLLAGPAIGLNSNGDDTFYGTTCELRKGKK